MKKNFFYVALWLMGIMGALSIWVVDASTYNIETQSPGWTYGTISIARPEWLTDADGPAWFTIMDRNLWAITTWYGASADTGSYWFKYQWGNNYGFADGCWDNWWSFCSDPVYSSSKSVETDWAIWESTYDNNWYYWTTFINGREWSYPTYSNEITDYWENKGSYSNLRWWSWDYAYMSSNWPIWLYSDDWWERNLRQWPCPSGYHVPSAWELVKLLEYRASYYTGWTLTINRNYNPGNAYMDFFANKNAATEFEKYFMIPAAGSRHVFGGYLTNQYKVAWFWTSSINWKSSVEFEIGEYDGSVKLKMSIFRANGFSVRCFKDSYGAPTIDLNLYFMPYTGATQEIWSGTVTENMTWSVPSTVTIAMNSVVNTGYTFSGSWSLSWETTAFDFENRQISWDWADTSGNVYFIAKWTPITYTISFSWNAADATWTAPDTINAEYDSGDIAPDNSFTLTGYTFTGWNTESDGSGTWYVTWDTLINLTTTSGAEVKLYAQWEVNVHKLNFVVDGTNIQSGDVAYSSGISAFLPSEPKKDCNSFAGWTSSVEWLTTTGTMPDSDVTFTANWNYTCSRSSGWWGSSRSSSSTANTQDSSTSSQNDDKTQNSSAEASEWQDNTQDSSANASEWQYSEEFQKAYEFAYKHGITTMDSIEKADMEGPLTRIAMAKMLSYYAINVLWLQPDETRVNKFNDVSDQMDAEYNNAVSLAYQLWIMWINMPKNRFRPNDLVTRAEFATALSRMLYKIADWKDKYYSTHLAKLMEEKIITNNNPNLQELRGYVMIMLMRSAK